MSEARRAAMPMDGQKLWEVYIVSYCSQERNGKGDVRQEDADVVLICDSVCAVCGVNFYSG